MTTTNANPLFRLRRQEDIVSSIINFVGGHTPKISDFNEGSIIRSLIEGVSQEIFRQNVVFAQSVADSVKEAIRHAFGLPLKSASKAYGLVTFKRKMLDAPTSITISPYAPSEAEEGYLSTSVISASKTDPTMIVLPESIGTISNIQTYTINGAQKYLFQWSCTSVTDYVKIQEGMRIAGYSGTVTSNSAIAAGNAGYCGENAIIKEIITKKSTEVVCIVETTSAPVVSNPTNGRLYKIWSTSMPVNTTYYYSICPVFCGAGLKVHYNSLNSINAGSLTIGTQYIITNIGSLTGPNLLNAFVATGWKSSENNNATTPATGHILTAVTNGSGCTSATFAANSFIVADGGTGYDVGDIVTVMVGANLAANAITSSAQTKLQISAVSATTSAATAVKLAGPLSLTSSGLTNNTDYYVFSPTYHTVGIASNNVSIQSGTTSETQNSKILATNTIKSAKMLLFRSTNQYFLNSVAFEISNPCVFDSTLSSFTIEDTNYATGNSLKYPGRKWMWAVAANNVSGQSLAGYAQLSPETGTKSMASITWNPVSAGDTISAVNNYSVWRTSLGLDKSVPIVSEVESIETSGVSGLIPTYTYWYSISAIYSDASESPASDPISLVVPMGAVYSKITWYPIEDAIGYRIYRSSNQLMKNSLYIDLENVGQSSYIDTNINFVNYSYSWTNLALISTVSSPIVSGNSYVWKTTDSGKGGTFIVSASQNSAIPFTGIFPQVPTAQAVSGNILIGAGTRLKVPGTSKYYEIPYEKTILAPYNSYFIIAQAKDYGSAYNTNSKTIIELVDKIFGIDSVYNEESFINGQDIETEEEWRLRFTNTVKGLSRGTLSSIESGSLTAKLYDENGFVIEEVKKVLVREIGSSQLRIDIDNGNGYAASQTLVNECKKIIDGYVDTDGTSYAGYKPAGVVASVYPANFQTQDVYAVVSTTSNYSKSVIRDAVENAIYSYFAKLDISDGFGPPKIIAYPNTIGTIEYQYQIVSVSSTGAKTLPSDSALIPNGNAIPNNTVTWSLVTLSGAPTVTKYDILRWDPEYSEWRLVETVNSSVSTYVDTKRNSELQDYAFSNPQKLIFQKSELTKLIMAVPGISSVKLYLDSTSRYIYMSNKTGNGLTVNIIASSVNGGVVSSITVNAGGANYAKGDIVQINGTVSSPAFAMITGIDYTGAVTSLVIVKSGYGYSTGDGIGVTWPIPNEPSIVIGYPGYVLSPGIVSVY